MIEMVPGADGHPSVERLIQTLQHMKAAGWRGFDCRPETLERLQKWPLTAPRKSEPSPTETLEEIRADLGECQRCGLSANRTRIVFGEGNPRARLVFVGEGPGADEDRQGRPFVGAAGQLLTKIIGAMTLDRDQVYIANVVKCRPPGNRNPATDEIGTCRPFLMRQLAAIQPEFICVLGKVAAHALLGTEQPISRLRGRFHDLAGLQVMPTYHPAYLLRSPEKKRDVWGDVQQIMAAMNLQPPRSS